MHVSARSSVAVGLSQVRCKPPPLTCAAVLQQPRVTAAVERSQEFLWRREDARGD